LGEAKHRRIAQRLDDSSGFNEARVGSESIFLHCEKIRPGIIRAAQSSFALPVDVISSGAQDQPRRIRILAGLIF
jgi:hypothetical protein